MSQSAALEPTDAPAPLVPFEHRLYMLSPFGILATTALIFVLLYGGFLLIATLERAPTISFADRHITMSSGAWPALVLVLLCCTALGVQRYIRTRELADVESFTAIFKSGRSTADIMGQWAPHDAKLGRATFAGLLLGVVASVAILASQSTASGFRSHIGTMVWFLVVITLLMMSFTRGVEMSRKAGASFRKLMESELVIDLLRVENLAVLGRSAARGALIWFSVTAVVCLFFVGGGMDWFTVALLVACAAMGLWMFVGTLHAVHRKIHAAKTAELEHTRREIEQTRRQIGSDPHAASRLQGLLAYETRIHGVREWPFDQSTAVRVAAYVLIPAIPWFGQAVAQYFVEHFVRFSG
ncbi:MAG: hypothetical protein HY243_18380 [Proteobacteria bacterium]|nr:hypothetical protein [Pseudomonadota bacterium]